MTTKILEKIIERLERHNSAILRMLSTGDTELSAEELEILYDKNLRDLQRKRKELEQRKQLVNDD
jgi:hypothetical protein